MFVAGLIANCASMRKKRTEISIEIDEVIQGISHRPRLTRAWCPACASEALMITPEQAAAMTRATVRTVNQRVEAGSVHFLETTDGLLFVCVNSLNETSESRGDLAGDRKAFGG